MRSKEEAHDYRYFPDPDLLPLEFDEAYVAALEAALPELPDAKRVRFQQRVWAFRLRCRRARRRARDSRLFRGGGARARRQAGGELGDQRASRRAEPELGHGIETSPISAEQLGALLDLQKEGTISGKIAKDVFEIMLAEGGDPRDIVEKRGLKQVTDTGAIEKIVGEVVAANPEKAEQAKAKPAMLGWFVGQVMKASQRQGQPAGGERAAEGEARDRVAAKTNRLPAPYQSLSCSERVQGGFPMRVLLVLFVMFGLSAPAAAFSDADRSGGPEHDRAAIAGVSQG